MLIRLTEKFGFPESLPSDTRKRKRVGGCPHRCKQVSRGRRGLKTRPKPDGVQVQEPTSVPACLDRSLCTMPEESNRQVLYHHWKDTQHTHPSTVTINPEFICTYVHKPYTSTYEPCLVGSSARICLQSLLKPTSAQPDRSPINLEQHDRNPSPESYTGPKPITCSSTEPRPIT